MARRLIMVVERGVDVQSNFFERKFPHVAVVNNSQYPGFNSEVARTSSPAAVLESGWFRVSRDHSFGGLRWESVGNVLRRGGWCGMR
jgi:hypothetical protein